MRNQNFLSSITEGVIWKQLLLFFFPILMGSFFQQLYNTVDTIIVGRAVGTDALAAVGAASPIISLLNGFFIGLSSGATVILAQACGANDRQGVKDTLHTGMTLAIVLGLIITALGIGLAEQALRLVNTPAECLNDAALYCRIYFSGSVAAIVYNMGSGILRAMGDSKGPMIFLILSCFANIVLDLLFVVVIPMGIAGAAMATVLAQVLSAVLVVRVLARQEEALDLRRLGIKTELLMNILRLGVPAGLQYVLFDVSNLIIQSGINSYGNTVVAAWTAYLKTDGLNWMINGAFGVAVTTFAGQNFGAQKYARVRRSVWTTMAMSLAVVGTLSGLIVAFRYPILSIYSSDPAVVEAGAILVLSTVTYNVLFIPVEVFGGAMRGTGYALVPTVITCVCICLLRVLWVLFVVPLHHTMQMLTLIYPITWGIAAVLFFIVYLRGNWLRKPIKDLGLKPEE